MSDSNTHYLEDSVVVELSDTDMARFIHFSSVIRYFDVGLRNVLEASDLSFQKLFDRGIGLPVVNVECDYKHPMMYGDRLTIRTEVAEISEKTLKLSFNLKNEDGRTTATGSLTAAFYDIKNQEGVTIPQDVREKLNEISLS